MSKNLLIQTTRPPAKPVPLGAVAGGFDATARNGSKKNREKKMVFASYLVRIHFRGPTYAVYATETTSTMKISAITAIAPAGLEG